MKLHGKVKNKQKEKIERRGKKRESKRKRNWRGGVGLN